ncbi:hypothetical protein [Cognatiyoonia sp. IB215182]|uniref:hypothetical protein n=1 Tax=Cognatiyoonia sp. IB215182 TaxID=3097353 RepID=UPI002A180050|nr:hypothetical protein [Cognatiyoonia sp. IB215182]MDX8350775.1 hypothetical protein [Cognatiyoonia sp. IB215182]
MKTFKNSRYLILVLTLLSACGGGGGGGNSEPPTSQELVDLWRDLDDRIDAAPDFSAMNLPTSGGVRYAGPLQIVTSNPTIEMWGQMHLDMNFSNDEVTGGAQNFRKNDDTLLEGSLTLIPDQLIRSEFTPLTATFADARLTEPGVTYDIERLGITGRFYGTTGELMTGIVSGDVVWDNTPASINDGITLDAGGDYILERED